VNSGAPERKAVPASLVAPVLLLVTHPVISIIIPHINMIYDGWKIVYCVLGACSDR
jgi:hypothetical protein